MSVLITGGAGFIGSHLAERLLRETQEQIVLVDNFNDYYDPRLKRQNLAVLLEQPRILLFRLPAGAGDCHRRQDLARLV